MAWHPEISRRTAQRILANLAESSQITAQGEGRARRYFAIGHPAETHTLPYFQPFTDINKRTSRLAANLPLFRANLCPLTFLDVPEQAYSRATLGVYEMTRVELLRDLYIWAYERSTLEYLAIKQDLAEPDPLRLAWRDLIKKTIREIVTHPELDPLFCIQRSVAGYVSEREQPEVQALIVEKLRRLHEGVLARYGLRPSEFMSWKSRHGH
ncbi:MULTISPECIES: hypothetical protein [Pseudomonas]|uniref:hypothetical protein n=1 Tax=Pseudomonas TaxID=286 RepID=UPI001CEDD97F|nr:MULTISPECIES: hypothetical protein [Pseudomonas]